MKKCSFPLYRQLISLFSILVIVLVQFPVAAPAFSFSGFNPFKKNFVFQTQATEVKDSVNSLLATFTNAGSIPIADATASAHGQASPYPSTISVSGLSGTLNGITLTLNNASFARTRDIDIILVAPTGAAFMVMSDVSDGSATSGANITFSDAGSALPATGGISSGTYVPTDIVSVTAGNDVFPAPAPSYSSPATTDSATFASVFNGINPNGTWSLYIQDDAASSGLTSSITGGWTLNITTAGAAAATTTTVSSSLNPSLTTQSVTFTATVTSGGSPVTSGTVSFTQNGSAISAGCTNVAVNVSGQATCTATAGTLPEGMRTITATYSGTASFGTSNGSITQTVNSPTVVSGNQFCNNGGIAITNNSTAVQYPSNITVSGLTGTISKVTVNLNNVTLPNGFDLDLLLVGPGGQAFVIVSDVGDTNSVSGINLTLDDAAGSALPIGSVLTGGTFKPTDNSVAGSPDNFPAPAPGTFSTPAPTGTATFASVFNTLNPNGNWALYAVDDALGGSASSIGSYCLNFTLTKFSTSTSVTSSMNPVPQGASVTFTATVTTTGTGTPSGTVEFFSDGTSIGTGTLNGAGQATLTTSALPAGTRSITAQYLGANVGAGGGGYSVSTSGALSQMITGSTAAGVTIEGRVLTASGRGISKALVTITDNNGNVRYAVTNPFGFYRFVDVEVGEGYLLNAAAKNKQFTPQFVSINQAMDNLDFVAIE